MNSISECKKSLKRIANYLDGNPSGIDFDRDLEVLRSIIENWEKDLHREYGRGVDWGKRLGQYLTRDRDTRHND